MGIIPVNTWGYRAMECVTPLILSNLSGAHGHGYGHYCISPTGRLSVAAAPCKDAPHLCAADGSGSVTVRARRRSDHADVPLRLDDWDPKPQALNSR